MANIAGIIARRREIKALTRCCDSTEAELIAVYGRRRVGKTFLIRQFFKDKGLLFTITGIYKKKTAIQLAHFETAFNEAFSLAETAPEDWFTAFDRLRKAVAINCKHHEKIIL